MRNKNMLFCIIVEMVFVRSEYSQVVAKEFALALLIPKSAFRIPQF